MKVDRDLKQAIERMVRTRFRRRLRVSSGKAGACRIRRSNGLDKHVAARHTKLLHHPLDREFGPASRIDFSDDRAFQDDSPTMLLDRSNRVGR